MNNSVVLTFLMRYVVVRAVVAFLVEGQIRLFWKSGRRVGSEAVN